MSPVLSLRVAGSRSLRDGSEALGAEDSSAFTRPPTEGNFCTDSDALNLLLVFAVAAGLLVIGFASMFPAANVASPVSIATATGAVEQTVLAPSPSTAVLAARFNPQAATGLALSVALGLAFGGGMVLAVLAYPDPGEPATQ